MPPECTKAPLCGALSHRFLRLIALRSPARSRRGGEPPNPSPTPLPAAPPQRETGAKAPVSGGASPPGGCPADKRVRPEIPGVFRPKAPMSGYIAPIAVKMRPWLRTDLGPGRTAEALERRVPELRGNGCRLAPTPVSRAQGVWAESKRLCSGLQQPHRAAGANRKTRVAVGRLTVGGKSLRGIPSPTRTARGKGLPDGAGGGR